MKATLDVCGSDDFAALDVQCSSTVSSSIQWLVLITTFSANTRQKIQKWPDLYAMLILLIIVTIPTRYDD